MPATNPTNNTAGQFQFAKSEITMPLFDPRNTRFRGRYRIRPLEAANAALRLALDPDDTGRFGSMVSSLSGMSYRRYVNELMKTPEGKKLVAQKPNLLDALRDRERLHALPEGTLGKAYAEFADREGISGDALADILWEYVPEQFQRQNFSDAENFFSDWGRDFHDILHLVLGYDTDLLGELGVLTFSGAQTGDQGVLLTVTAGQLYVARYANARRLALDAVRRARQAKQMALQNWVELLDAPIELIRRELNVGPPPIYKRIYTKVRGK